MRDKLAAVITESRRNWQASHNAELAAAGHAPDNRITPPDTVLADAVVEVISDQYEQRTIDILRHQMTLPIASDKQHRSVEEFDPWQAFPCFYGSYSSEFDDMAILVLENIRDGKFGPSDGEGLAHEMFREVLCTADLCDYGTSPRGCFPNWGSGFEGLLPDLIEKWRAYRAASWGED